MVLLISICLKGEGNQNHFYNRSSCQWNACNTRKVRFLYRVIFMIVHLVKISCIGSSSNMCRSMCCIFVNFAIFWTIVCWTRLRFWKIKVNEVVYISLIFCASLYNFLTLCYFMRRNSLKSTVKAAEQVGFHNEEWLQIR